jgi:hypothetical protein
MVLTVPRQMTKCGRMALPVSGMNMRIEETSCHMNAWI